MMIRTKYIAVFFFAFIVVLVGILLYLGPLHTGSSFSYAMPNRALVIDAVGEEHVPVATVVTDSTREDTRRSLHEALRNYTEPPQEMTVTEESPEETVVDDSMTVTPPTAPASLNVTFCSDGSGSISTETSWGGINVTLSEGARLVSSLAVNEAGDPVHALQLNANPTVMGSTSCLPFGMIGIALDGRIIKADTPFSTNVGEIAGYALDGFGIFGMYENEALIKSSDLDECHGHVHPIMWNGELTSMYHYHVTGDSPYTLGCFRGTPVIP